MTGQFLQTEFEPYQDAVVDRLIELLLPDPHAKLETRVLSSLASNVALIGSRYKYDKEIRFLYKVIVADHPIFPYLRRVCHE